MASPGSESYRRQSISWPCVVSLLAVRHAHEVRRGSVDRDTSSPASATPMTPDPRPWIYQTKVSGTPSYQSAWSSLHTDRRGNRYESLMDECAQRQQHGHSSGGTDSGGQTHGDATLSASLIRGPNEGANATTYASFDFSMRSVPVSTLWCRRYHRAMVLMVRRWFNHPSDIVRLTSRSPKANRGRRRLPEVVMVQTLRETSSTDVGCYRAYAGAIGSSPAWQGVLAAAVRVATTEATVFLQGESGTGKEVVARLIHQAAPRKHGPFVAINCAA